jgi:iron complex outermembrane receptor protein
MAPSARPTPLDPSVPNTPDAVAAEVDTVNPVPSQGVSAEPVEGSDVVVTGSSIRGVAPTGSNLISLGRDTIQAAAPANTKEMLSAIPQLGNFGANAEQSTPSRFRTSGFQPNIHNLGTFATLTLFNGHRFAPVGGEAVFPDPSIIPTIAVQRVEVIADGASSVYGSDAVAGVVNFIYRRNVQGIEAQATYGFNETRYEKRNAAIIGGHSWGSGSVMAAYEYSDNKSPFNTEIATLALGGDQRSRGGRDLRANTCLDPNVTVGGRVYAAPALTLGRNLCGVLNQQQVIPDGRRHAVLVTARQNLGETVELWTELNYSHYRTERTMGRQALNLTIPNTNPYFRLPPGVTATSIAVTRSGLGLFPGAVSDQTSEVFGVTAGADVRLGGDWVGNVVAHVSKTLDYNKDPELDLLAAQRLANGTTRATALNPFGQAADNDPAVLAQIDNDYAQINDTSQRLRELQVKADGPIVGIGGGQIRASVGLAARSEQAVQLQTAGSPTATLLTVRDDDVSRTIFSAFSELNVPLFSTLNGRPGLQSLVLSLAGRYDYYDNLGGTFNPKYGIVWSPIRGVSLHGSYGTSFAAPNIGLTTSTFTVPRPNSSLNLTDVTTGTFLGIINALNPGGGNPDLTPEEATTWSAGVDFAPMFAPRLRLSGTYYNVQYRNTVNSITSAQVLTIPDFRDFRILNPTAQQVAEILARFPPQAPVTTTFDAIIYLNAQNIGERRISGIDLEAAYSLDTGIGHFDLGVNANRQLTYKQRVVASAPFLSRLGTFDAVKWKGRLSAGWNLGPVSAIAFVNYIDSFINTTITPNQKVKSFTTVDLSLGYQLDALVQGAAIQLRAANLFDQNPPFYDNGNGYFPALASPFGRTLEATLRFKF